jgi:hypothetical protein
MTDKLEQEPVALSRGAKKEIIDTYIKLHEGKIGMHWLWAAILRIVNGESEPDVMDDFGYQFMPTEKAVETAALIRAVEACEARAKEWDDLNKEHAASYAGELRFMAIHIQSLITEDGKDALRELMLQAINEWEVSTADCKEDAINQILESK